MTGGALGRGRLLAYGILGLPLAALGLPLDVYLPAAASEADFDAAKDYARRASGSLDDAAMSAKDYDCSAAFMEFYAAALYANWARHASSPQEFFDSLNRAIRAFNCGLEALQSWARKVKE